MGGDELSDCSEVKFFFLGFWNDNVGVWGISSSFTSKFELWIGYFFFVRASINWSPMASVWCSFFIKNAKSISGRCRSFEYEPVFLWMGTPPLQIFEIEVDGY